MSAVLVLFLAQLSGEAAEASNTLSPTLNRTYLFPAGGPVREERKAHGGGAAAAAGGRVGPGGGRGDGASGKGPEPYLLLEARGREGRSSGLVPSLGQ